MLNEAPRLSIVIVSFNTRDLTVRCLHSLYADLSSVSWGWSAEILVVDNASTDGTLDILRSQFPQVHLIENKANRGFGAANNQAMEIARGRFFLLLNSDAFVAAETCRTLVEVLERRPEAGVVGPRLINADGSLQRSCFPFPTVSQVWLENTWGSRVLARLGLRAMLARPFPNHRRNRR